MKRFLAVALAAALLLLCACGGERQRTVYPLTVNGTPLDGEVFTFFLDKAVNAIPDGSQEEQINYATQLCIRYVAVNSTFAGAGLTLTAAEKKEADEETNVQWNLYERYYESIGVSRQTFSKLRRSDLWQEKLRQAYFGEGGTDEVPAEQLRAFLETRYVAFRVIRIPKKVLDANGTETDRDEAQQTALNEKIAAGLSAINETGTGIESVFATFVSDRKGDREEYSEVVTDGTDHAYPAEFVEAIRAVPVNTAAVFDFNDAYYLTYREDITEDEDIFEAYKGKCLSALTEFDLQAKIDRIGKAFTTVKDQAAMAECWNNYWNALAKNNQANHG